MSRGRIVALGGLPEGGVGRIQRFLHELAGGGRPRILDLPTAQGDDWSAIGRFHDMFGARDWEPGHLRLFGVPRTGWRELVLEQQVIWVNGGNTANLLGVWRAQGFDLVVRQAWENGAVLAGASAGAICWFEACVTDSFRTELDGLHDGLGFLEGSCCPHYDGEERRRPRYRELVAGGFPAGLAIEDAAAAVFEGRDLVEVVSALDGAAAYRVSLAAGAVVEQRLAARAL